MFDILKSFLVVSAFVFAPIQLVSGHGYVAVPPARNVVTRGSRSAQSYNSNGPSVDTTKGHGLCGGKVEGSPILNEFIENGEVVATYVEGQEINIEVVITAHHWGWFEFRLCPLNNDNELVTQECLNQHILKFNVDYTKSQYLDSMRDGVTSPADYYGNPNFYSFEHAKCPYIGRNQQNGGRGPIGSCCNSGGMCSGVGPGENEHRWMLPKPSGSGRNGGYNMKYILPDGVTCDHCVLQWFYQTGNSPDSYPEGFWNCVDIKIIPNSDSGITKTPSTATKAPTPTNSPAVSPTTEVTCANGAISIIHPTDCAKFYLCDNGKPVLMACGAGLYFNVHINACDWPSNVECHADTSSPVVVPTNAPVSIVTKSPSIDASSAPVTSITCPDNVAFLKHEDCSKYYFCSCDSSEPTEITCPAGLYFNINGPYCDFQQNVDCSTGDEGSSIRDIVLNHLRNREMDINNNLLISQTPDLNWVPSTLYNANDFIDAVTTMHDIGAADQKLFLGDDSLNGKSLGLVNLAAFLAQSMKETIQYDACDENNWDQVNGKYAISNACGQLGQSYQDYTCFGEEDMQCDMDMTMEITATTHAKWYGAPGPLKCGPKSKYPQTGYWDYTAQCNKPWANPPEFCDVYEGQKAGKEIHEVTPNAAGRTDVENCCWWGRGVIQTTGRCNFGKLNYYLGARAARDGRDSPYPEVDFCKTPDAICSDTSHPELKWIAGLFYWMNSVQQFNAQGFNYMSELKKFVESGYHGTSFIDAISGIVNRGCPNLSCPSGDVANADERRESFAKALRALGVTNARRLRSY